jgi:predicted CopG family antitoxin
MGSCSNYLGTFMSLFSPSKRRKKTMLKRIVISEHNYHLLKKLRYAGDSFNDVIGMLLRVHEHYRKKQQKEAHTSINGFI